LSGQIDFTSETERRREHLASQCLSGLTYFYSFIMERDTYNQFSKQILDASIFVHKEMGPGLLESVYELCLAKELQLRGIKVERQVYLPLYYRGEDLGKDFRIDLLIEDEIIIEIKAVEGVLPVHEAQIISYLKLADKKLGLLINFNVPLLKHGFRRFVNDF
jgi:GxxExxY protein